jgi:hypothetical protein
MGLISISGLRILDLRTNYGTVDQDLFFLFILEVPAPYHINFLPFTPSAYHINYLPFTPSAYISVYIS